MSYVYFAVPFSSALMLMSYGIETFSRLLEINALERGQGDS